MEQFGDSVRVYQAKFAPMFYALKEGGQKPMTVMKVVCTGPDEKVVGLHMMGRGCDEMLQGFGVAIKMGATKVLLVKIIEQLTNAPIVVGRL